MAEGGDEAGPGTITITPHENGAVITITRNGAELGSIALQTDDLMTHIHQSVRALLITEDHAAARAMARKMH